MDNISNKITSIQSAEELLLEQAKTELLKGNPIIIPTETVYGIAVNATNNLAVEKIYKLKGRNTDIPLQILCANYEIAKKFGEFNATAEKLAKTFYPGPITIIVEKKKRSELARNINVNNNSIGIRIPNHKLLLRLLAELKFPLAASSANLSGKAPATNVEDAVKVFNGKLFGLNGGECVSKVPSTVVDARTDDINILREEAISEAAIKEVLK